MDAACRKALDGFGVGLVSLFLLVAGASRFELNLTGATFGQPAGQLEPLTNNK